MTKSPEKLIIEPTTRCNFKCEMCVNQSKGHRVFEEDLSLKIFKRLLSVFEHAKAVVFTEIGEPLLNKHLEHYI